MTWRRSWHGSLLLLAALSVAGCGGAGGPELLPVSGRLTLDGQPLPHKTIRFVPEPGTPGLGAGATTDATGMYTLLAARPQATRDMPGAPAGAYRVVVTEPMFPIDTPLPKAAGQEPAPAIGLPAPNATRRAAIPPAYTSVDSTPLQVEVSHQNAILNLDLRSPP